ncbi:phage holin family protein [Ornithinibacter aureus]|uniref:Phage holin family protein n=1 Tax=Ornithinibacter aureus TaxID=622664 RepID=A0ABP8JXV5_9MICO|nr:phage holin family protein [Ornithinibacter aureus]KAF0834649.1 putative membrane protein [Ornithinibacter aureus]
MKNFLIRVGVNGVALWVAALVLPGINLAEGDVGWGRKLWTIFFVAVIFGVVNAIIKPIAQLLSLPFIVLTLGLFIFIVNAFMLQLTEWVSGWLDLSFSIDQFFWDAIFGAIVITLVSWVLNVVLPEND